MNRFILLVAQGFGAGLIPVGPGTAGSVVGLLWMAMLIATGSLTAYLAGIGFSIALSVWFCGAAEKLLGQKDPGSVVLDEIIAIPICFLPWAISLWRQNGAWPSPEVFFVDRAWIHSLILFGLFRVFDIAKPWPIGPSQNLPGGWGITVDDVLAGLFTAALSLFWLA